MFYRLTISRNIESNIYFMLRHIFMFLAHFIHKLPEWPQLAISQKIQDESKINRDFTLAPKYIPWTQEVDWTYIRCPEEIIRNTSQSEIKFNSDCSDKTQGAETVLSDFALQPKHCFKKFYIFTKRTKCTCISLKSLLYHYRRWNLKGHFYRNFCCKGFCKNLSIFFRTFKVIFSGWKQSLLLINLLAYLSVYFSCPFEIHQFENYSSKLYSGKKPDIVKNSKRKANM